MRLGSRKSGALASRVTLMIARVKHIIGRIRPPKIRLPRLKIARRRATEDEEVPRQIQDALTRDEVVEESFDFRGCRVYATSRRLLKQKGRTIRDFDYGHISSVAYSSKRCWWLIALGVVFVIIGVYIGVYMGRPAAMGTLVAIGAVTIVGGAIIKSEWIEVSVVGVSYPQRFEGSREMVESLLQIIRLRRDTEHQAGQGETKGGSVVETIRKLADLRDEGIITEEEFLQKKRQLLRSG